MPESHSFPTERGFWAVYSPLRPLLLTAALLFLTEGAVMWSLHHFGLPGTMLTGLLDAGLVTAAVLPALYLLWYRPMVLQANQQLRIQQRMALSEKLSAAGLLASGAAHEINNPLNSILGLSQVLIQEGELSEKQRKDLKTIERLAMRAGRITKGLLDFSRKAPPRKEIFTVASLLNRALPLVEAALFKAHIHFEQNVPSTPLLLYADPDQLEQVLVNLILNAKHALKSSLERKLTLTVEQRDGRIFIHLRDTGCGIPMENQDKIFDPFFTTKPAGMGTGLGLSIAYGIISSHGGRMRVSSPQGGGASFTVELPECHPAPRLDEDLVASGELS